MINESQVENGTITRWSEAALGEERGALVEPEGGGLGGVGDLRSDDLRTGMRPYPGRPEHFVQ